MGRRTEQVISLPLKLWLTIMKKDYQTRIIADGSPTGLGAILVQRLDDLWRVISYGSQNLTGVEQRYSQTEKAALALVWACERFQLHVNLWISF